MLKNKLKKTKVLVCGPPTRRETVPVDSLSTGEASIPFSRVVETPGVTFDFDADLSFEQQVSSLVRFCFSHTSLAMQQTVLLFR